MQAAFCDEFDLPALGAALPSIDDFVGNYTLNGPVSMFNGLDPLARPVSIEKVDATTLVIKGIAFAASVYASFDPATGFMSIGFQFLDDHVTDDLSLVDLEFLTYDEAEDDFSEEAVMTFRRASSGELVLTGDSEATGYMIWCDEFNGGAGRWINGWYRLSFSPVAASTSARRNSVSQPMIVGSSNQFRR